MTAGLDIRNTDGNIVIDQNYSNLYLSRKIKASTLPVAEFTGHGTWVFGSFWGRKIELGENEVVVAVGRENGGNCPYWIHYGAINNPNIAIPKTQYLFAAEWFYAVNSSAIAPWTEQGISTGISDSTYVDDDVYVYVFATNRTVTEHGYGMQVFDENGSCVYDSNDKSARVLYAGGTACNVPLNKKIAIAPCGISMCDAKTYGDLSGSAFLSGIGVYNGQTYRAVVEDGFTFPDEEMYFDLDFVWTVHSLSYIVFDVTNY